MQRKRDTENIVFFFCNVLNPMKDKANVLCITECHEMDKAVILSSCQGLHNYIDQKKKLFNLLPDDKILDRSKLKQSAFNPLPDDKF